VALRDISNGEWTAIQSNNWEVLFDLNQTPTPFPSARAEKQWTGTSTRTTASCKKTRSESGSIGRPEVRANTVAASMVKVA
jgi:hypothetical protein